MLKIVVVGEEYYDEEKQEFFTVGDFELELEHSLVSLSKWESKYKRPFLGPGEKTLEETLGYIEAMVVSENPPKDYLAKLSQANIKEINAYIESNQTGTTFNETKKQAATKEIISSELIYYWMVAYRIPFEVQYWHLSRLFALIRICGIKQEAPKNKKINRRDALAQRAALNKQRREALGTTG
jgi:hypothetical protein